MKEFLEKLSSYNLFNYLLPGIVFVVILEEFTTYSITQKDLVFGVFVYYFTGLVISRLGSLIIEPVLKKITFLKFADYVDFLKASKSDTKIEILSEANNMYRTFIAMLLLLLMMKLYDYLALQWQIMNEYNLHLLIILLLIMFLYSYRKQTKYVTNRIKATLS
jgi:hypothetical protein